MSTQTETGIDTRLFIGGEFVVRCKSEPPDWTMTASSVSSASRASLRGNSRERVTAACLSGVSLPDPPRTISTSFYGRGAIAYHADCG